MFETFRDEESAAHLRGAAAVPLVAFLVAQSYFTFYPWLARVPAWLFWTIDLVLFAGFAAGIARAARIAWPNRRALDGRAWAWLVVAIALSLVCAWQFAAMTFPWLL